MRSTVELADQLGDRGHRVDVLLGEPPSPGSAYDRAVRAHVKTSAVRVLDSAGSRALRWVGARDLTSEATHVYRTRHPENAYRLLVRRGRPDVVVANSLPRFAMRWIDADLRRQGIPLVVYMREAHSVTHFSVSGIDPAAVIANSRELQTAASAVGISAEFVPSIVDLDAASVETSRRTAVLINPVAANRPELIAAMAARRRDIPFVLQESWPLGSADLERIDQLISANVVFRRSTDKLADVYRDARVLVAPYPAGRPRVILEAHHNGIPVVGLDQPALAEAIGPGGILISAEQTVDHWLEAVERCWDDSDWYESMIERCREWAGRDEVQAVDVVDRFEKVLEPIVRPSYG